MIKLLYLLKPAAIIYFFSCPLWGYPQLKTVIEDFEGFADGQSDFSGTGMYAYGDVLFETEQKITSKSSYSGRRALRVSRIEKEFFGGWGMGLGLMKELDAKKDYINFYLKVSNPEQTILKTIRILIQDDDNHNITYEEDADDTWYYDLAVSNDDEEWRLISIPLSDFKDLNKGGDHQFNINHREGRLLTLSFDLSQALSKVGDFNCYFDFISFSEGRLQVKQEDIFEPETAQDATPYCLLGAWVKEETGVDYLNIARSFENQFTCENKQQLGIVSFYVPFAIDGSSKPNLFPSLKNLNHLIDFGYIPMITLESQYAKAKDPEHQPNLYAIVEGHYDYYFEDWARRAKEVKGKILLRILHEFNGDWYPWCIINNDHNPDLYKKAYIRIRKIFKKQGASNVLFVWCPNAVSSPQTSWNYIMKAYPGNEHVDFLGLDIFNGAGQPGTPPWVSFRRLAMDNYYLFRKHLPDKPVIVCETSSRERHPEEKGHVLGKADWIAQASETIRKDLPAVQLIVWFDQDQYRVRSSIESWASFTKNIWLNDYFKSGSGNLLFPKH